MSMNMMQVRWSLNGQTPTKRKTLACDYNPIHKRLRDFGHDAQELVHASDGKPMVQPQNKPKRRELRGEGSSKANKAAKASKAADALADLPPVTLQSIVAELESAGLLENELNAKGGAEGAPAAAAGAPAAPAARGELSVGVTGLLSAAGLMPGQAVGPSANAAPPSSSSKPPSEAGGEAPSVSDDAGSSYGGSTQNGGAACEADGIDPFSFLQQCKEPAAQSCDAGSGNVSADDELEWPGMTQTVVPLPLEDAELMPVERMPSRQGCFDPSVEIAIAHPEPDEDADDAAATALSRASTQETVVAPPQFPQIGSMEYAFEALADELETDSSTATLMQDLHGLYDLDDSSADPPLTDMTPNDAAVDRALEEDDNLLLSLDSSDGSRSSSLLADLGAAAGTDAPMTFTGFDGASLAKAKRGRKPATEQAKEEKEAAKEAAKEAKRAAKAAAKAEKPQKVPKEKKQSGLLSLSQAKPLLPQQSPALHTLPLAYSPQQQYAPQQPQQQQQPQPQQQQQQQQQQQRPLASMASMSTMQPLTKHLPPPARAAASPKQPKQPQHPSLVLSPDSSSAAKPPRAPAGGTQQEYWTHPSMLPPAPKSGVKFLPGAVETPAPPPTKISLSGRPSSQGSAGKSFSWQPMRMPTYK